MPRKRSTRLYREPTQREVTRILFGEIKLGELFDDQEIEDLMAAARRRVIGEFYYAMEKNPRFKAGSGCRPLRRTDNYILGVKSKPSELARYVVTHMRRPFIKAIQLPSDIGELHPSLVEKLIKRVQQEIVLEVILTMRNREVWYDEGFGIWQACQSTIDEFLEYKRAVRRLADVKVDDRSYHGRVRAQSKARGVPEGVSVSFAG